ncbi:uncharacterized protein LOC123009282 [Tribolium madens]|uniref:uncharacterized protein LOC123009282 n=1 Tax=Tribolium madens TaxID=41895 RepID=UPI001CF74004|nr:uncharacterized protein LOC123009282 [Tribolium madens]
MAKFSLINIRIFAEIVRNYDKFKFGKLPQSTLTRLIKKYEHRDHVTLDFYTNRLTFDSLCAFFPNRNGTNRNWTKNYLRIQGGCGVLFTNTAILLRRKPFSLQHLNQDS